MTLFCANNTSDGQQYDIWVAKTIDFLESTAPYLGEGGRCCSVMFKQIQEFYPSRKDNPSLVSKHRVKMGIWNGIKTIGIPHPSGRVNNDDWGTIALF